MMIEGFWYFNILGSKYLLTPTSLNIIIANQMEKQAIILRCGDVDLH